MYRIEFADPDDPMGMPATITGPDILWANSALYNLFRRPGITHAEIWKD